MRPRLMRWLAVGGAMAVLASACTFGSDDEGGGTGGSAAPDEPVTLRVWTHQNKSFNQGLKDLGAAFESENPNVTLEFETFDYDSYIQTLQTALPAGTEADILQMFGTWTCSYADFLAPVPGDVQTLEEAQAAFYPAPIGGYTCDDTLYGFPNEFNIEYGATLVNTAIAEDAGVDWETGWEDWDAFRADALKMTDTVDGNVLRAGYHFTAADGLSYSFFSLLVQAGGSVLNEDGTAFTIDTPEAREAFSMLESFVDAGVIDPVLFNDEENWVGECYFQELCAAGLVGPWVIRDYQESFPDVVEVTQYVALPPFEGSTEFVADSGWGMTVSKTSPAADAAWDFIAFTTLDPENAAAFNLASGSLPALVENGEGSGREGLVSAFPYFEPFLDILPNARFVGSLPDRDLVWYEIAYPHLLAGLQGEESVDDMLASMQREANETFS
jgi:multiple sugar transport system substrate-binding protein